MESIIDNPMNNLQKAINTLKTEMLQQFNRMEKRFEQIYNILGQMDTRFEQLENRIVFIDNQQMKDRTMLMDIWRDREKVTVTFSKTFAFINILISGIVAGFVSFFTKHTLQ